MRSICFAALALFCALCFMESSYSTISTTDLFEASELVDRVDDKLEDSSDKDNADGPTLSLIVTGLSGSDEDIVNITRPYSAANYFYHSQGPPLA